MLAWGKMPAGSKLDEDGLLAFWTRTHMVCILLGHLRPRPKSLQAILRPRPKCLQEKAYCLQAFFPHASIHARS